MDNFLKYFENKTFIRWVLYPDNHLDEFWKEYLRQNPQENEQVKLARLLVLSLKSKEKTDFGTESIDLFSKIVTQLDKKSKRAAFFRTGFTVMKYAAVGMIFFLLGITYYNYQKPGELAKIYQQMAEAQPGSNDAQLILGDGKNVIITEKESKIEYQADGKVVVNTHDTIRSESVSKKSELNQLIVPFGKNSSVKLPDGTTAYLNAGSRLVYPSFFEGKNREVFLIGEGFFDVVHNPEKPFVVKTSDLEVEVLGTRFNVSAYPTDNIIETVLVSGKVKVKKTGFHLLNSEYILEPSQRAAFNRQNAETNITNVDVLNYVTWREGYLDFEQSDLNRIVKKLERYYDIKIRLHDPVLGIRTISGKLKLEEETESVLKVLANTASSELIKINEKTYVMK